MPILELTSQNDQVVELWADNQDDVLFDIFEDLASLSFPELIEAHLGWRASLKAYLLRQESFSEADISDCTRGRFGTWLYSVGFERYGECQEWHALERSHSKLHIFATEAHLLFQAGLHDEAMSIFNNQVINLSSKLQFDVARLSRVAEYA